MKQIIEKLRWFEKAFERLTVSYSEHVSLCSEDIIFNYSMLDADLETRTKEDY